MQTITIHTGLVRPDGQPTAAQLLYTDGLQPEGVLVALRQAEAQIIAAVVMSAEQRGREQAQAQEGEAPDD